MTKVSTISACYKSGKYLKGFLDNVKSQTHKDLEIVLDHNEPTDEEIMLVEDYNKTHDNIFHIQVEGVDPLGISWNRCIEFASGDYLCIWNVDDLRTPDSIEVMAKTLDENPDVDFVYGNYHIVSEFGLTQGQTVDETGREDELTTGMILGPFFMFRKSFLKMTGVFDEQFTCCNDYDLAMRFARCGKGMHIPKIVGYYLNEGLGQSTKSDSVQPIERTVIELRYNIRVLEPHLVPHIKNYDVENIIVDDVKTLAKEFT
tara:strand:- start:85 stop:861 length:777 start_codon:yes stop_codon:yes gene_type:complete